MCVGGVGGGIPSLETTEASSGAGAGRGMGGANTNANMNVPFNVPRVSDPNYRCTAMEVAWTYVEESLKYSV